MPSSTLAALAGAIANAEAMAIIEASRSFFIAASCEVLPLQWVNGFVIGVFQAKSGGAACRDIARESRRYPLSPPEQAMSDRRSHPMTHPTILKFGAVEHADGGDLPGWCAVEGSPTMQPPVQHTTEHGKGVSGTW